MQVNTATKGGGVTTLFILRDLFKGDKAKYLQPGKYGIVATNKDGSNFDEKIITVTK